MCRVCLSRRLDHFATGRLSICKKCIDLLNGIDISPRQAVRLIDDYLRRRLQYWDALAMNAEDEWRRQRAQQRRENPDVFEHYFASRRAIWRNELVAGTAMSFALREERVAVKVLRAYRRGLLRANPDRNAGYPDDWTARARGVRQADGDQCRKCQAGWEAGVIDLHVHHIIYRSNGGKHNANNLVTLCNRCHGAEHGRVFPAVARSAAEVVRPFEESVPFDIQPQPQPAQLTRSTPPPVVAQTAEPAPPPPKPEKTELGIVANVILQVIWLVFLVLAVSAAIAVLVTIAVLLG